MNCLKDEELHVAGEESVNGFCLGINPSDIANLVGFVITREPLDVSYYNNNKIICATLFCKSYHDYVEFWQQRSYLFLNSLCCQLSQQQQHTLHRGNCCASSSYFSTIPNQTSARKLEQTCNYVTS